jgi:hypothetical protein
VFEVKKRVLLFILGLILFFIGDLFFKNKRFLEFSISILEKKIGKIPRFYIMF